MISGLAGFSRTTSFGLSSCRLCVAACVLLLVCCACVRPRTVYGRLCALAGGPTLAGPLAGAHKQQTKPTTTTTTDTLSSSGARDADCAPLARPNGHSAARRGFASEALAQFVLLGLWQAYESCQEETASASLEVCCHFTASPNSHTMATQDARAEAPRGPNVPPSCHKQAAAANKWRATPPTGVSLCVCAFWRRAKHLLCSLLAPLHTPKGKLWPPVSPRVLTLPELATYLRQIGPATSL